MPTDSRLRLTAVLLILSATFLNCGALTGSYPSSVQTDVAANDSTKLYPEESQRKKLIRDSKVLFINGDDSRRPSKDSVEALIARFYVDQFRHSQDPEAPYFTFMSKGADLAMGIGAVVKMRGWFDWNGIIDGASFNTYLIQIPKTPETDKSLGASVAGTTIFFSIMGTNRILGDYRAYIEGGFNGYANSGFKLKKAWVQIRDFTAGLATTTFSDPAAQPDLLDGAGANGKVDKSNILVRYLHTFGNRWTVAASAEIPSSQPDVSDPDVIKVRDYVPDFAALGQFSWNRGLSHIRLAAILRTMAYMDILRSQKHTVVGWGTMLGTSIKIYKNLNFYGQASFGQGMSSYNADLSIGTYDLLSTPYNPSRLYAPTTWSGTLGIKYFWMENLTSTVALATLRTLAKKGTVGPLYKYGQYLAANLVYDITPRVQIGVEYEAGKRMNYDGSHANDNRFQAVMTASF